MFEGDRNISAQPTNKSDNWDFESLSQSQGSSFRPFISVVLTCRERKTFIIKAVDSIFQQTLPHEFFEVIVVKSFVDVDIDNYLRSKEIVILQDTHHELGHKIASGAFKAKGDVISFLEDDDEYMPTKLEVIYALFFENKNLTFVRDRIESIDEQGSILHASTHSTSQAINGFVAESQLELQRELPKLIQYGAGAYVSAMSIRRTALTQYIEKLEILPGGADAFLFTVALASGGAISLESKVLTRYRVHDLHSVPNNAKTLDQRETNQTFIYRQRMYAKAADMLLSISEGTVAWEYACFFFGANVLRLHLLDSKTRTPPLIAIKYLLSQYRILFKNIWALKLIFIAFIRIPIPNTISKIYTDLSIRHLRS